MYSKKITLSKGNQILTRYWHNKEAVADIFMIHGFLEHSGRYQEEADFFMNQKMSVYSYDHRGHGLSDGRRSYISKFKLLVQDFEEIFKESEVGKQRPYYFFAHSMGGLVLLSYLLNQPSTDANLKGVILSAPFLMPDPDLAPFLQKIAGILGTLTPLLRTVGANPELISRDPATVTKYIKDPLVDKKASYARSAYQLLKQMNTLKPMYNNLNCPLLLMHGTDDKLSAIEGSQYLFDQCQTTDKKFVKLKGFRHEITRELEKETVFATMKKWLSQHPPKMPD